MKLQFSLATFLILVTICGAVAGACLTVPVETKAFAGNLPVKLGGDYERFLSTNPPFIVIKQIRPTFAQAAMRMAWALPLAIATTLAVLWLIRRLRQSAVMSVD